MPTNCNTLLVRYCYENLTITLKKIRCFMIGIYYNDVTSAGNNRIKKLLNDVTSDPKTPVFPPHSKQCELNYFLTGTLIRALECRACHQAVFNPYKKFSNGICTSLIPSNYTNRYTFSTEVAHLTILSARHTIALVTLSTR